MTESNMKTWRTDYLISRRNTLCERIAAASTYPEETFKELDAIRHELSTRPPCGECHLQPNEKCGICGATNAIPEP